MALTTYVLKCILPPSRAHRAAGARHWFHAPRLLRPIAYAWHRHVASGPVVHVLTVAQGACRYVPLALGVAAGVTMSPGAAAPSVERPVPSISTVSAAPGPVFSPDSAPFSFAGLPESAPQSDVSPAAPVSDVPLELFQPPEDGSPGLLPPKSPPPDGSGKPVPPQTVGHPSQPVPEAPSLAVFLPVLALLALARRTGLRHLPRRAIPTTIRRARAA